MKNTELTVKHGATPRDIVDIRSQVAQLLIRNLKLEMPEHVTPEKFASAINGKVWRTKDGKIVNVYFNTRNDGEHFRCEKKGDKYIYTLQLSREASKGYENLGGRGALYRVLKNIAFSLGSKLYVDSEKFHYEELRKQQDPQALSSDLNFEAFGNGNDEETEKFDANACYRHYYEEFQYYNNCI